MRCLDILWMVISPSPTHSFRIFVVWHDIAVVGEILVANGTLLILFDYLAIQQFPHLSG